MLHNNSQPHKHNTSNKQPHHPPRQKRPFTEDDIDRLLQNLVRLYDFNGDGKFSKKQFPKVLIALGKIIDSPIPSQDQCMDIFNLLDANGDEVIDRGQMRVLLVMFFKLILKSDIKLWVSKQWTVETPVEELKKLVSSW